MSQAARIEKFEKITLGRPPDQPLPAKTLMGHPGQKIWDGTSRFWVFGQKPLDSIWLCIKKPPQPYGLQKNPGRISAFSHFGSFWGELRVARRLPEL